MEYAGPGNDVVTVYNDGAISYRDPLFRTFRGRICRRTRRFVESVQSRELQRAAGGGAAEEWATVQAITLLAARYQYVMAEGEAALAPLVQRMRELRLRALSHTHFLLTAGPPQKIAILPWPYADVKLASFPESGIRRCIHLKTVGFPTGGPSRHACPAIFSIGSRVARDDGSPGTDPGPRLYFKEGERLFRVTKFPCAADDAGCHTFKRLSVQEIHDLDTAVRVQARNIRRTIRYSGPEHAVAEEAASSRHCYPITGFTSTRRTTGGPRV